MNEYFIKHIKYCVAYTCHGSPCYSIMYFSLLPLRIFHASTKFFGFSSDNLQKKINLSYARDISVNVINGRQAQKGKKKEFRLRLLFCCCLPFCLTIICILFPTSAIYCYLYGDFIHFYIFADTLWNVVRYICSSIRGI